MEFDPSNMNNEEFNPDLYVHKYVINCPLQHIMAKRNNLDNEIQALKTDMQALLYDNYTKVFDASSVISKMNNNFCGMMEDMELLQTKITSLKDATSKILGTLQPSEEKLLTLMKRRKNFRKLMSLTNFVPVLKKLIEDENLYEAVQHYLKVEMVLKKYQFLPSIAEITGEINQLMAGIRIKLKEELDCDTHSYEKVSVNIELLLKLGEEWLRTLTFFLKTSQEKIGIMLTDIDCECELFAKSGGNIEKNKITIVLSELSLKIIDMLTAVVTIVRNVFFRNHPDGSFVTHLETFVTTNVENLFQKIRYHLREYFCSIDDECLSYTLDGLYRRVYKCSLAFPKTPFFQKNTEFVLTVAQDRCAFCLDGMISGFRLLLQKLNDKLIIESQLNGILDWFDINVEELYLNILFSLRSYIKPEYKYSRDAQFRKLFCKVLSREKVFLMFMRDSMEIVSEKLLESNKKSTLSPAFLILLSKYALKMHESKAEILLTLVDEQLPASAEDMALTATSEVLCQFKTVAIKLLTRYVKDTSNTMSLMLRNSFENKQWMEVTEPRRVSAAIRRVLEDFDTSFREVKTLYGDPSAEIKDSPSDSSSGAPFNKTISLNIHSTTVVYRRISKLFHKPPVYLEEMQFTGHFVLSCIMRMTLKSLLEYVRQRTFNRFGMQQVQVDVHCLQSHVMEHLKKGQDFISLFDDIISSCYSRSFQPEFMNPHVVSAICQAF